MVSSGMKTDGLKNLKEQYERDGFISPVRVIPEGEARKHRDRLESAESQIGSLHYKAKVHTILTSPFELVSHPAVLNVVEQLLGPDILLYSVEYIIKEPHTTSFVSWHQDLTYWGFDADDQVSMWLALSPATAESGCMRMVPGSHTAGMHPHEVAASEDNILFQGQTVSGVDESDSVVCDLRPGEASFHHGWTLHSSMPNRSGDRRIGLNAQYIKPSMRQTKRDEDTALLVRGEDRYGHFKPDIPASVDLDPVALVRFAELNQIYEEIVATS